MDLLIHMFTCLPAILWHNICAIKFSLHVHNKMLDYKVVILITIKKIIIVIILLLLLLLLLFYFSIIRMRNLYQPPCLHQEHCTNATVTMNGNINNVTIYAIFYIIILLNILLLLLLYICYYDNNCVFAVIKLALFLVYRRFSNSTIKALALDHRNDVISNSIALTFGFLGFSNFIIYIFKQSNLLSIWLNRSK